MRRSWSWVLVVAMAGALAVFGPVSRGWNASHHDRVVTLEVGGMTCDACVAKIHTQLARVPGVIRADLSLHDQRAIIQCRPGVADSSLIAAVRRAGPDYLGLVVAR